ncbi:MAG TPA: hypothetical protein VFI09_09775 [Solirubrobacterales bacterium]|nr:hypothetical protein [Solirubrobacterales bacterium]
MSAKRIEFDAIGAEGAELARYRVSTGERVLMGWGRPGGIEVSDVAVERGSRGYVVDRGFRCPEQLAAFLGDYLDQARRFDACPMGGAQIGAMLAGTESEALAPLLGSEAGR